MMRASKLSFMRRIKTAAFSSFFLVLAGLGTWSCLGEDALEATPCPNHDVFVNHVSPYLERRCGMLDCHGQETRWFRVYGELGLRHPDEMNFAGGAPTTPLELESNFAAVCNLDPEAMRDIVETLGASADKYLLVTKARGDERHKGGKVVNEQDEGDRCILDWLKFRADTVVQPDCQAAVDRLK